MPSLPTCNIQKHLASCYENWPSSLQACDVFLSNCLVKIRQLYAMHFFCLITRAWQFHFKSSKWKQHWLFWCNTFIILRYFVKNVSCFMLFSIKLPMVFKRPINSTHIAGVSEGEEKRWSRPVVNLICISTAFPNMHLSSLKGYKSYCPWRAIGL